MKKIFKSLFPYLFLIGIFFSLGGCTKDSINGHLDGRWQIMEISNQPDINMKDRQLYYNFYLHVCNLSGYGGVFAEANLLYRDERITLSFPYLKTPEAINKLQNYGIYSNPVSFEVVTLTRNRLVMKDGDITITLRKF